MEFKFSQQKSRTQEAVRIGDTEVPTSGRFRYLGSILQRDGRIDEDVRHRIQARWSKWRSATRVLCDRKVSEKLKGKFYRTAIRPAMLYGTECWATKHEHEQKMKVAEMRMLRWICGHSRMDKIRNEVIRERVGVAPIEEKMMENRLRWYGHIMRRDPDAPVRRCAIRDIEIGRRGRGRPRKTWWETIRKDLELLELDESVIINRTQWRNRIHIADPT